MDNYKVGQKVLYRYQCGWGGGDTRYATATIKRLTKKQAVIELVETKGRERWSAGRGVIEKRVAQSSLSLMDSDVLELEIMKSMARANGT